MSFVKGVRFPELGRAAGFALWSFRALASGCRDCRALGSGFELAFGAEGAEALGDMVQFARVLGTEGRRRIMLAAPGCGSVTADELSVLAALAAAQSANSALCAAHLTWLLSGADIECAYLDACRVADRMSAFGLTIAPPALTLYAPDKPIKAPVLSVVGNA